MLNSNLTFKIHYFKSRWNNIMKSNKTHKVILIQFDLTYLNKSLLNNFEVEYHDEGLYE